MTSPAARASLVRHGDVAVVRLDASPVNALGWALRKALREALDAAAADRGIAAIVLQGAGRGFCAGGDLGEVGSDAVLREPRLSDHLLPAIERAGKPVIAAIHGFSVGGGLELALACHGRVVGADALVGLSETRRGLIALRGTQHLPRALPFEQALRLMVDGALVTAATLAGTALFDRVVAADPLVAAIELAHERTASPQPLLRERPLCVAGGVRPLQSVAEARAALLGAGAPEGVDTAAALATLDALRAACEAADFDAGLARAAELHLALHRRRPAARAAG